MTEIENIVAGVDGSDNSRTALHWAYAEAAHHGASLTVVTTWHPPTLPMTPPYGALPTEDYEMQPRTDALALLDRLRATGVTTPVLVLSALSSVDERIRGLRAGGDDYLSKPFFAEPTSSGKPAGFAGLKASVSSLAAPVSPEDTIGSTAPDTVPVRATAAPCMFCTPSRA